MSRDTLNGTRSNFFVAFAVASWLSALPQFVKTAQSGDADLASAQFLLD
jgi:hypothetical protein